MVNIMYRDWYLSCCWRSGFSCCWRSDAPAVGHQALLKSGTSNTLPVQILVIVLAVQHDGYKMPVLQRNGFDVPALLPAWLRSLPSTFEVAQVRSPNADAKCHLMGILYTAPWSVLLPWCSADSNARWLNIISWVIVSWFHGRCSCCLCESSDEFNI